MHKVVFTDIDGTLIDYNTGEYGETKELIRTLRENHIPVILCSSKTWEEQNRIREDLRLNEPFIIENGGAIIIPKDYFYTLNIPNAKDVGGYSVIELGKPVNEVRTKLSNIREKFLVEFKSVGDVSLEELSKISGLPIEYAKSMAQRQYSETILQIRENDLAKFTKYAKEIGLTIIHGGRFFDVTIGNDKGKAVQILMNFFRKEYNYSDIKFFGLGDSENDVPMLNLMDVPILVQRPDHSWSNVDLKNVTKIHGIGPEGWKNGFNKIMVLE